MLKHVCIHVVMLDEVLSLIFSLFHTFVVSHLLDYVTLLSLTEFSVLGKKPVY